MTPRKKPTGPKRPLSCRVEPELYAHLEELADRLETRYPVLSFTVSDAALVAMIHGLEALDGEAWTLERVSPALARQVGHRRRSR